MKKKQNITTTEYSTQLNRKMLKATRHAKEKKIWRVVAFLLTVATCVLAVMFGINSKTAHLEEQYQKYCHELDRTILDSKLLEYKNTLQIFEQTSMGNKISQTQMGGFFYYDENLSIYPDVESGCTNLKINGRVHTLSEEFASNINVYEGNIYFTDTGSMELMRYDLNRQVFSRVDLDGVGQYAICDGMIVYKDSNSKELKLVKEGYDPEVISNGAVISFAVAGNQILYLQEDYTLHSVSISTRADEVIAHNVNSFFFNGELWIQNNTDIYVRSLDGNTLDPLVCEEECRRILGVFSDYLIFDGSTTIYVYNMVEQYCVPLADEYVFVGASDNGMILVYNLNMGIYQLTQL
jgi:hypothetical protein